MENKVTKLRTAVIGAGKMGGIHSKVYSQIPESDFFGVADCDAEAAGKLAKTFKVEAFSNYKELLGKVDAVTISTPTVTHCEIAEFFITNGVAVLIEKPLAASVEEGRRIAELAKKNNVVVAVGHSERCNPVVQAMKRLDIEPKFIEAHRISPYPFRSMDIGVVLDVMIHDLIFLFSRTDGKVTRVEAVGVNVIEDKEDICNARIYFDNGCIANVTASRLALKTERTGRVVSRKAHPRA